MGLLTLNELSGLGQTSWVSPQPPWGTFGPRVGLIPIPLSRRRRRRTRMPHASDFGHLPYGATVWTFDVRTMRSREVPIARISYMDSRTLSPYAKAKYDAWHRSRQESRRAAAWAAQRRAAQRRQLNAPPRVQVPPRHQAVAARRNQEVSNLISSRAVLTREFTPPAPVSAPITPRYAYSYVTPIAPAPRTTAPAAPRYVGGAAVSSYLPMPFAPQPTTGVY